MGTEWPLVGRDAELRRLRSVLTDSDGAGMLVAGAAGVGKTRLLHECLIRIEGSGLPCLRVTAGSATARVPFGALAPLLPDAAPAATGAEDLAGSLRSAATALVERAGGQRFVLAVDDAHLLDDASATLIHQLAASGALAALAMVRTGEPVPEPLVALWKDGLGQRMELSELSPDAAEELLQTVLGAPVDTAAVTLLRARSAGNLLFLRELVLGVLDDGTLSDDDGIWRLAEPITLSRRLAELVELRMGPLEPAARAVLEVVALGEPLGPGELRPLADPHFVEDLARKGLLASTLDRRRVIVRLAEPLYGDLLRSRIPALSRARITRSLVDAVEATGARRRDDTLRVAGWSFDAGLPRPGLMLAAAWAARWRYDFPLAERLALAASDDGAGFEAAVLLAQLACLRGRNTEAAQRLLALAGEAEDDAQRAIVAVTLIDTRGVYTGWMDEGLRLAEQVEAGITDPAWRDEITARRAAILLATDGPEAGARLAGPLVARASGRGLVWACMASAFGLARMGRVNEALEMTERGHAEHLTLTQPIDRYPWIHSWLRCEALAHAGRLLEAEALARAQYEQGVQDASAEAQAYFTWHLATVVGDRGHVQTAERNAREGIALNHDLARPHYVGECLIGLALALALAGKAAEAAEALAALDALDVPDAMFKQIERGLARGWAAVAAGDLDRADDLFAEAAGEARRRGDLAGEAAALHCRARIGNAAAVLGQLEALAGEVDGDLVPARAAHVRAVVAGDAAALSEVSASFEAMGADLLGAEAAADAAVAHRRRGEVRKATAAGRRAAVLRERCEGAVTPSLLGAGLRSELTRAERQTALMAAGGRSNREIALALCLSVRTVENHLQHVYAKLGVTGRAELAGALDDLVESRPGMG